MDGDHCQLFKIAKDGEQKEGKKTPVNRDCHVVDCNICFPKPTLLMHTVILRHPITKMLTNKRNVTVKWHWNNFEARYVSDSHLA